jgi:hypothetical protein
MRVEKAFGVSIGTLLRMQAWHDAYTMRLRGADIRCKFNVDFPNWNSTSALRNTHYAPSSASMAATSASQTRVPSTMARPEYHHMVRRCFIFFM